MAATTSSSYISSTKLPIFSCNIIGSKRASSPLPKRLSFKISAQQQSQVQESDSEQVTASENVKEQKTPRPVEPQVNVKSKNLSRDYGGQWLSSVTRHVRIYAAYIDPETCAMDQTQMDKLTLILDPGDEFLWTDETCNKVYAYFQELVDHYEHFCNDKLGGRTDRIHTAADWFRH